MFYIYLSFLSVFYISPDIESCTLKEYLIIYPHLTHIQVLYTSVPFTFYTPISILYLGRVLLSDDGKVWLLSYLSLWPLAFVTGWATSDEKLHNLLYVEFSTVTIMLCYYTHSP